MPRVTEVEQLPAPPASQVPAGESPAMQYKEPPALNPEGSEPAGTTTPAGSPPTATAPVATAPTPSAQAGVSPLPAQPAAPQAVPPTKSLFQVPTVSSVPGAAQQSPNAPVTHAGIRPGAPDTQAGPIDRLCRCEPAAPDDAKQAPLEQPDTSKGPGESKQPEQVLPDTEGPGSSISKKPSRTPSEH
ncbi:hypothetical protein JKI95_04710 [Corynebacterium aquatimens]|uniref:hypothetical protein n=1 Tax=Corynebacterium aquatimens TaxID=1190508 RepID=UPI002540F7FC|nr:hypothetical protein [Corynebacterium aquatimens]QYH20223.1 hypothetical protein JKI95_04710 [Corynebacterium aquatimens]